MPSTMHRIQVITGDALIEQMKNLNLHMRA